jgi:hypothetical protein
MNLNKKITSENMRKGNQFPRHYELSYHLNFYNFSMFFFPSQNL